MSTTINWEYLISAADTDIRRVNPISPSTLVEGNHTHSLGNVIPIPSIYRSFYSDNLSTGQYATGQISMVFSQAPTAGLPAHSLVLQAYVLDSDSDEWCYNNSASVGGPTDESRFVQEGFPYTGATDSGNYEYKVEVISIPPGAILISGSIPETTHYYSCDCLNTWKPSVASFAGFVRSNSATAISGEYVIRWFIRNAGQSITEKSKVVSLTVSSRAI